ncbi:hypothetical protein [Deinococcus aquaticus]|uniref:hypothetical protein n=1 Tax=Deinococcus aquaticus TaxID=328692 RepID=UPI00361FE673
MPAPENASRVRNTPAREASATRPRRPPGPGPGTHRPGTPPGPQVGPPGLQRAHDRARRAVHLHEVCAVALAVARGDPGLVIGQGGAQVQASLRGRHGAPAPGEGLGAAVEVQRAARQVECQPSGVQGQVTQGVQAAALRAGALAKTAQG